MTSLARRRWLRSVVAALVAAITASSGSAPRATAAQLSAAEQIADSAALRAAWDEIGAEPRRSLRVFQRQLPVWAAESKQSVGYVDADRGTLVAAILAGDDRAARAAWRRIESEEGGAVAQTEPPGDALARNGAWRAAFASFRAYDGFGTADCTVEIDRGLDQAVGGRSTAAIATWSLAPDCYGPYDVTDVQLALSGDALAAQGEWRAARSTWIRAARQGRVVPQIDALYVGNVMALSMLYRYRARMAT